MVRALQKYTMKEHGKNVNDKRKVLFQIFYNYIFHSHHCDCLCSTGS